jgi:hypothetical protein
LWHLPWTASSLSAERSAISNFFILFEASWDSVIADDFAEFRKAGLTHPMMADIEKELNVSR